MLKAGSTTLSIWSGINFLQFFLFPGYEAITYLTYPLGFISEFGLTLWLLLMGVREQKPASMEAG